MGRRGQQKALRSHNKLPNQSRNSKIDIEAPSKNLLAQIQREHKK